MNERVLQGLLFSLVILVLCGLTVGIAGGSDGIAEDVTQTEEEVVIDTDWVNINLQSQRTTVEPGETVQLSHSAANLHPEDELTVQLVLEAPSGADVSGTGDIDSGTAGQFVTTTELDPGEIQDQRIDIDLLEAGEYELTGQAIYYFGDDPDTSRTVEISLPIEKQPPPPTTTERVADVTTGAILAVPGLQHSLAEGLETRAASVDNEMILGIYVGGVVGLSVFLLVVLSPVVTLLTGRSIVGSIRGHPGGIAIAERTVTKSIMLVGFALFLVDISSVASDGTFDTIWSAQVLSALIVASPFAIVVSVLVLVKTRIVGAVIEAKRRLFESVVDR
ncbi:COG1361 family protein [Natronobacterium gregoryi]|uniref:Uncharacterized protein n=2 Tax=Natronobacterium gregoryi TaxID=44930 RepID=L0AM38_NATGS|nr:hypothetical protein [Natronobacterium gregoryi]AFZ74524.1 hypothetical protein Natgr_3404 [Natronobacterium gregoryi SP2]ELY72402.1 hypothetical protein C490_03623 [Natronobacterium gregoryi SP2]PLK21729.1 hypothetical protein CYV19_02520 [Natronobacterium gregoryi SP2]SFI97509.1 hypothetical protein SAMN05443661_110183 [Natronobacterium gregoryi]